MHLFIDSLISIPVCRRPIWVVIERIINVCICIKCFNNVILNINLHKKRLLCLSILPIPFSISPPYFLPYLLSPFLILFLFHSSFPYFLPLSSSSCSMHAKAEPWAEMCSPCSCIFNFIWYGAWGFGSPFNAKAPCWCLWSWPQNSFASLECPRAATWTPSYIPTRAVGSPYHIAYYGITNQLLFWLCQVWRFFLSLYLPLPLSFPSLMYPFNPSPPSLAFAFHLIFVFTYFSYCIWSYSLCLQLLVLISGSYGVLFESWD